MKKDKIIIYFLMSIFIFFFFSPGLSVLSRSYAQDGAAAAGESQIEEVNNQGQGADSSNDRQSVTLDYKDADLSSVLRALSYSYDLNLVVAKDIKGKVTVTLKDVTVDEALEAILSVNGYAVTKRGNLIYITPGPGVEGMDLITVPIRLSYLTAAEAQRLLGKVISSQGDIQINEATTSLVVTDFPANIEKIKDVLGEIDIPPVQVLIEAKIVDIQSKAYENFGTTYALNFNQTASFESFAPTTTMAGPSSTLSGGQISLTATFKNFSATATIDALIQQNKARLLASPSIATLNGKEARIIIGEKYPYKEKTQTTTGTTETTKFVDVGTTLRVTPRVSPDGWITMIVHPEVSSVSASLDAGPRITTREADATVRVRDGQTIIIGGLKKKKDDQIKGGIPVLRSIPILGLFFSKRSKDLEETDLTVFITPYIIRAPEELAEKKDVVDREIYLNLDQETGKLSSAAELFERARNLERGNSPESADKLVSHRKEELLATYKQIVEQYPQAKNTDFALYKIGLLHYRYFKEYKAAADALTRLTEDYPDSRYRRKASFYLKKVRKKLKQGKDKPGEKRKD